MQPNGLCGPDAVGSIFNVNLNNPGAPTLIVKQGAHPSWQPVPTGG